MVTIAEMHKAAKANAYKKDTDIITISMCDLGILVNYSEGIGVKDICDKHSKILQLSRQKAAKLRYHNMAKSILSKEDIIYDSRYADVLDVGDFEI